MENFTPNKSEPREPMLSRLNIILLFSCLIAGLLFNFLFFENSLGLNYPLYAAALYLLYSLNLYYNELLKPSCTWLLGIPVLFLSFTFVLYSNEPFLALNFLLVPVLLVAHTLLLSRRNYFKWSEIPFFIELAHAGFFRTLTNCLRAFRLLLELTARNKNYGKFKNVGKVAAGLAITIPLLLVIIPLLSSADDAFRQALGNIPDFFTNLDFGEFISRTIIVTIITCVSFGYLWSLFRSKDGITADSANSIIAAKPGTFLHPISVTTVLILVDLLYIFFIALQFSYFFGRDLPTEFTYANYARKGFFELVMVTVINLFIVLANINFVQQSSRMMQSLVRTLNSVLVLSTLIVLVSAHLRMSLYEEAYGFTYLRLLTHAFMGYLFILLSLTLGKIWRPSLQLFKSYILVSLVFYVMLNFANIDKIIVNNNIARYKDGNPIDTAYLTTLSYDAVPSLVEFINTTSDRTLADNLKTALQNKKLNLQKETSWQSWNLSKARAKDAFGKLAP